MLKHKFCKTMNLQGSKFVQKSRCGAVLVHRKFDFAGAGAVLVRQKINFSGAGAVRCTKISKNRGAHRCGAHWFLKFTYEK